MASIHQYGLVQFLETIDDLLGLQLCESTPDINDEEKMLILKRRRAREVSDWKLSDKLRDELLERGIKIRDTSNDTIWSRV